MSETSFRTFFGIPHDVVVRINATNICNIHCGHCDNDAHLPFSKAGELIFRREPLVADVGDVESFCKLLDGVGNDDIHLLQGGEITALPVNTIVSYIDIFHRFGRKVGMRTNGYNICGIPPEKLNLLDRIHLNSHGINVEAIAAGREYLERHYGGRVVLEETLNHRDLKSLVRHGQGTVDQGLSCNHLLATLTVLPPVILPCCNTWALMNSLNSEEMMKALIKAGWTVLNRDLKQTLQHWRQTLPRQFLEQFCADSCYLTRSQGTTPLHAIQRHPQDRVLKKIRILDSR